MKFVSYLLFLFFFFFSSCRLSSSRNEIIGIDSMKSIMWDMIRADEYYLRIIAKDTLAIKKKVNIRLYEEVFSIHHTSKKQFDDSYKYYAAHPDQYKRLVDSLDAFSYREKNKLIEQPVPPRKNAKTNIPK